jgi:hypothetical protein
MAAVGESSQSPAEASRPRPADQPAMAQPAVAEERLVPAVVGTQAAAAAVAEVQPAEAAATEARSVAPAAEEAERVQPAAGLVVAEAQPEMVAIRRGRDPSLIISSYGVQLHHLVIVPNQSRATQHTGRRVLHTSRPEPV